MNIGVAAFIAYISCNDSARWEYCMLVDAHTDCNTVTTSDDPAVASRDFDPSFFQHTAQLLVQREQTGADTKAKLMYKGVQIAWLVLNVLMCEPVAKQLHVDLTADNTSAEQLERQKRAARLVVRILLIKLFAAEVGDWSLQQLWCKIVETFQPVIAGLCVVDTTWNDGVIQSGSYRQPSVHERTDNDDETKHKD